MLIAVVASLRRLWSWGTDEVWLAGAPTGFVELGADVGGVPAEDEEDEEDADGEEDVGVPVTWLWAAGLLACEHELADQTTAATAAAHPVITRADRRGEADAP